MVLCQCYYDNKYEHIDDYYEHIDDYYEHKFVYFDIDINIDVDKYDNDIINMICKQAYAIPGIWLITSSSTTKQLAGSCEVSSLKLISTGGSAHVKLYDSVGSADSSSLKWALDSSTYTNDTHDFVNPLVFEKGIYAVCEDGFTFNPILCLAKVTPR